MFFCYLMTSSNLISLNFAFYYSIGCVTKVSKCKQCIKEIKMKNDITINASLCLLNDHLKDVVFI
jgi:hypothetical protein